MIREQHINCVCAGVCVKYGIKKKEAVPVEDPGLDGRLGRKKKTPEEMEAEANGELPTGATGEGRMYIMRLDVGGLMKRLT